MRLSLDSEISHTSRGVKKQHWFVWLQYSWVSGSCQSAWALEYLSLVSPLPLSSYSPPPPQVCGSSRHYYSCYVHLFVYSHYCGWCCLRKKVKSRPRRGSGRNQPEAFALAEVRQPIRITATGCWWALDKQWIHSIPWCSSDTRVKRFLDWINNS